MSDRTISVINEPVLEGVSIRLESLSDKHVSEKYANWLNDKEVCRENSHGGVVNTVEMTRTYVQSVDKSENIAAFAIIAKAEEKHIGNISLGNISWKNNSGEISILIGDKNYWGKGVGLEAYEMIIAYAFGVLGLYRLYSGMTVRNKAMIKVAEKAGMVYEGISKATLFKNGKYVDIVRYAIVKSNHENEQKEREDGDE
ncbi:MAG: GNAT family protein [Candidatus Tantalella remota]|nr:GNAT family protein [Candidatus Tantalella remota]